MYNLHVYRQFTCVKTIYMGEKIQGYHKCEGGIEKIVPRITFRHHMACPQSTCNSPMLNFVTISKVDQRSRPNILVYLNRSFPNMGEGSKFLNPEL